MRLFSCFPDIGEVNGLTVDWISRHLYWTDATKRSIEVSHYDGTNRVQLAIDELVQPRAILADPLNGGVCLLICFLVNVF